MGFFYSPPLEGCPQGGVVLVLNVFFWRAHKGQAFRYIFFSCLKKGCRFHPSRNPIPIQVLMSKAKRVLQSKAQRF